jgi:hypothetical protein
MIFIIDTSNYDELLRLAKIEGDCSNLCVGLAV